VNTSVGGMTCYGVVNNTTFAWGVPFNFPRPSQHQTGYQLPDEMFIANANFSKWIYFSRSALLTTSDGSGAEEPLTVLNVVGDVGSL